MASVPVAEGVFTWPSDEPQLIGSRCTVCGIVTFPTQDSCPRPSPPYTGPTGKAFVPFGVGYVELPGEVKVETRLTESDPEVLALGMEMELVVVPFRTDDDGNEVVTFAFRPVKEH